MTEHRALEPSDVETFVGTIPVRMRVIAVALVVLIAVLLLSPAPFAVRVAVVAGGALVALAVTSMQARLEVGDDQVVARRRLGLDGRPQLIPLDRLTRVEHLTQAPYDRFKRPDRPYEAVEKLAVPGRPLLVLVLDGGDRAVMVGLDDPQAAEAAIEAHRQGRP